MKNVNVIVKILAALAAVAGVVYVIAAYGDKIVALAKKLLGKDCCCDCDCCCDDEDLYEVECPACGEVICIDGCIVDEGEMDCPNCGEHLEFEMDEEEEDEE